MQSDQPRGFLFYRIRGTAGEPIGSRTIRALLTPTKMNMGRNEFVTYVQGSQAAKKTNYAINASTKAQLVSLMDREKKKSRSTENGDAACFEGSWGTLSSSIERRE